VITVGQCRYAEGQSTEGPVNIAARVVDASLIHALEHARQPKPTHHRAPVKINAFPTGSALPPLRNGNP
tara:strand:+ start:185 stop:391 length:207 start_codon:yes stop_codon:yes gene_type:complete